MRILRVGDPHAKVNNLSEMTTLMQFVLQTAREHKVDRIELLGDLFHTHAVVRLEVLEFWHLTLRMLASEFETVVLVGNHDQSGDYSKSFSALSVFAESIENLIIIEQSTIMGVFGYVPYIHNQEVFINSVQTLADGGANVLICHQTIQGSRYESGFYASDGIPTGEWATRFKHIISGHIHSEQSFENIIYPGTARWDSVVDANQSKGIWLFKHSEDGTILKSSRISTEKVCSPITELQYNEGEVEPVIPEGRVSILLIGTSEWVRKEKEKFVGKAKIRTKFTDTKKTVNRKIGVNFEDFLRNAFPSTMDREHLLALAKEMNIV